MKSLKTVLIGGIALVLIFFMGIFHNEVALGTKDMKQSFLSFWKNSCDEKTQEVVLENKRLETEVDTLKKALELKKENIILAEGGTKRFHYKTAKVFSKYPLNDRNLLMIDLGSEDGIAPNMPVMIGEDVLLGKVRKVSRTESEVETFFDPLWKSSVGIGIGEAKSILEGGVTPKLSLIAKDADIKDGDRVVNLSEEFPMGVLMGVLENFKKSDSEIWSSGNIKPMYDIENLSEVQIVIDFP